jgi:hypothetical protein
MKVDIAIKSLDDLLAMVKKRAEEAKSPELRQKRIAQIKSDVAKYEMIV